MASRPSPRRISDVRRAPECSWIERACSAAVSDWMWALARTTCHPAKKRSGRKHAMATGRAQRRSRSTIRSGVSSTSERRILRSAVGEFAVTAIGRDRPGIVARLSEALLELEGNIEDSQMSILRGHFAVMLIVKLPDGVDPAELERRLEEVRSGLDLEAISISAVDDLGPGGSRPSHILTVYGADRPGI